MTSRFLFLIVLLCVIKLSVQKPGIDTLLSKSLNEGSTFFQHVNNDLMYKYSKIENPTPKFHAIDIGYLLELTFEFKNKEIFMTLIPETIENTMINDMPVWTVNTDPRAEDDHTYSIVNNKEYELPGTFYKNIVMKAVLYESIIDGEFYYEGVIGEGNDVKILSTPIRAKTRNIIPYDKKITERIEHYIVPSIEEDEFFPPSLISKTPLKTLYPKLLLVLEYNYFKMFNKSIADVIKYMKILYMVVNMKYEEIKFPEIKIAISGIVISKDEKALSFYKINERDKRGIFDQTIILGEGNKYFSKIFVNKTKYNYFDSAVTMSYQNSTANKGLTSPFKICEKSVIIVNDDTKYSGYWPIAHELAHSFGVQHDDTSNAKLPNYSTLLYPSLEVVDFYRHYWSDYSVRQLKNFAKSKMAYCLEKNPFFH